MSLGGVRLLSAIRKRRKLSGHKNAANEVSVFISPGLFVMALCFVAMGMAHEFVCSLCAVILHELAHSAVAKRLGFTLNRIKLMPYGASLCGDLDLPAKSEILIALAGPLLNIILALIFAATWWLAPAAYGYTYAFCACNVYIGVFNLLPVYPLDGGRIVMAVLRDRYGNKKAQTVMRIISAIFGVLCLVLFAVSAFISLNPCFLAVGVFMIATAFIPDRTTRYAAIFGRAMRERLNTPLKVRTYAVKITASIAELVKKLDPENFTVFYVYDNTNAFAAVVDEKMLLDGAAKYGYSETVERLTSKDASHNLYNTKSFT